MLSRRSVSYREFNARTDALAAVLAERGVGPESLVAVFLERSVELVVALHAMLDECQDLLADLPEGETDA